MAHTITDLQPQAVSRTAGKFKHPCHRTFRDDDTLRHGLGTLLNAMHDSVCADKNYVEWNVGVSHPHAHFLRNLVGKKHAFPLSEMGAEHEPHLLLPQLGSDLHLNLLLLTITRDQP